MPQVEKLLVFLAAPGDVPTGRRYVGEIVTELNRTVASDSGVVLQLVNWENDAFPAYGQDAQAVINEQIAEMSKYALFIGIMWNRLGTPTPRAASGTVEEFERAVEAFRHKRQPAVWFYFRESASRLDTEDQLEQRKKVLAFKKNVQANGMPWTYKSPSEFRNKFRDQMILWLNARSRTPQPVTIFRDTLRDGSQGPDMMVVPPATFLLANTTVALPLRRGGGAGFSRSTISDTRVSRSIARFAIGCYQVTFEEYDRFAAATGRESPSCGDWGGSRDRLTVAKTPVVMFPRKMLSNTQSGFLQKQANIIVYPITPSGSMQREAAEKKKTGLERRAKKN